ncbi:hypothetical protein MMC12_008047 [Toensbergia leucococca]|nr:hypothetical protein [Toensbergia leucococca]
MGLYTFLLFSLISVASSSNSPQHIFANPPSTFPSPQRIPTVHESAVLARRILNISSIATLSTVFPATSNSGSEFSPFENRPDNVGGSPLGLTDYYASCGPHPYDPTIIAVSIANTIKNTRAGSNITLSLRYHPPSNHPPSDDIYTYSPANLPRFSLLGHLEPLSDDEVKEHDILACYLGQHPDAVLWTPGNEIHESWWGKLVVDYFYWFGGFGDRALIGWIPVEEWRGVTEEEVERARLVGEDGRSEMWMGYEDPLSQGGEL